MNQDQTAERLWSAERCIAEISLALVEDETSNILLDKIATSVANHLARRDAAYKREQEQK